MAGAATPPDLLAAVASAASGGFITNPVPQNPTGTNAASVAGGFPPVTMQPELSGGEPPLGQDMNGYLFLISSHTLYVECGQTYKFNATLAAQIGGYLSGTILGMADNSGLWLNLTDGNSANPDTGGAGWVPITSYGFTAKAVSGGTVTLTPAEARYGVIVLTGTLTSNLAVNLPVWKKDWLIVNGTTGAFATTVKTASGTGVVVPQGGFSGPVGVYSIGDGNIYPTVAPVSLPIDQAATPLTIAQRTNAGYLLATYFNQNSGIENPTVGSVLVQNSAADGFLRKIALTNLQAQMALQNFGGAAGPSQVPLLQNMFGSVTAGQMPALSGVSGQVTAGQVPASAVSQYFSTALIQNGHCIFPNGLILQWGFFQGANTGAGLETIPLNIAYPHTNLVSLVNTYRNSTAVVGSNFVYALTTTTFQAVLDRDPSGFRSCFWISLGY